jgi:hypothetical protein
MDATDAISRVLTAPTPEALEGLQLILLAVESDPARGEEARRALDLAGEFHGYLCDMGSKLGAREYSQVASFLDIGAVGAAALEGLSEHGRASMRQIALAALSETLMVMASRQYVKAWSRELEPLTAHALWLLRGELWRLSLEGQPDLSPDERAAALNAVVATVTAPDTPPEARLIVLGRLFQIVLFIHVARALGRPTEP